jgi:hypothetical protein
MLSDSADTEDAAILVRDRLREQVRDNTAAWTNVTLGYLLDEWLSVQQVEETTRDSYQLLINGFIRPALGNASLAQLCRQGSAPLRAALCRTANLPRRCHGRAFVEHRTPRPHTCDERCAGHVGKPLAVSSVRQCHAVLSGALNAAKRWGSPSTRSTPHTATHARATTWSTLGRRSSQDRKRSLGAGCRLGNLRLADLHHRSPARGAGTRSLGSTSTSHPAS